MIHIYINVNMLLHLLQYFHILPGNYVIYLHNVVFFFDPAVEKDN